MPIPLTPRQASILNFVERYTAIHHYPPTLREIADHYGLKSPNSVKKHLDALVRKGYLTRKAGARRALQIAGPASPGTGVAVPILGQVAAGRPILAEEHILGSIVLDRSLIRWNNPFLLAVKGDSMTGAGILDGDYVLVSAQAQAEPSDIVVALLDDEATVKRLARIPTGYALQPDNPRYSPTPLTPDGPSVRIVGKVRGVLRLPHLGEPRRQG